MSMGKGLRMVMMTDRRSEQEQGGSRTGNRVYNLDGTYNVRVGDGSGNRSGDRRIGDPRSEEREQGTRMGYNGEDEEESTYKVRVSPQSTQPMTWPYAPGMTDGERYANYGREDERDRQIGFGAAMHMDGGQQHRQMQRGSTGMMQEELPELDEETAIMWVDSMQGEDRSKPQGGKWTTEQLEPLAKKYGIPTKGPEWWQFYAVVNAMYADYCEVAKAYNITSPDFYAKMALAFIRDKDALPDKVERYLRYVVGM